MATEAHSPEKSTDPHLFMFAPLGVWLRLLLENRGVARKYWRKLFRVLFASAATLPFRIAEKVLYSRKVADTEVSRPPLFILGYARSGTTHLHNLLAHDPNLGYLTTFQAIAPKWFLVGRGKIKRLMQEGMQETTRPMDNVAVSLDMPQEEEVALANSTHLSIIHTFSFPSRAMEYFKRYLQLFGSEGLQSPDLRRWEREYLEIVRKATLDCGGRRIVQKTPAHQTRIPTLLRMFPGAKFVHIVRDPYLVYSSMVHTYSRVIPPNQLEDFNPEEFHEYVVHSYVATMKRFLDDVGSIPQGDYVEVKFEDLETDPIGELRNIYTELDLGGWDEARAAFERYLSTVANYKKNRHELSKEVLELVSERWRFALDHWGYPVRAREEQG